MLSICSNDPVGTPKVQLTNNQLTLSRARGHKIKAKDVYQRDTQNCVFKNKHEFTKLRKGWQKKIGIPICRNVVSKGTP